MGLFQAGQFRLHSGETSLFKIDCDALSDREILALACLLKDVLPRYGKVEGVPRGGLRLAKAMEGWSWSSRGSYPALICDDVYTTGGSMEAHRAGREYVIGAVLFARRPVQHGWITALFTMAEGADT